MVILEINCNFILFFCNLYKDYKIGLCVDCDNFKIKSCFRLGKRDCYNYYNLWKMSNIIVLVVLLEVFLFICECINILW